MGIILMKNICIVGYGAIGPVHADGIAHTQNGRLYAVCDINPDRIKCCQAQYEHVIGYENFDEMLKDENIDSVHICTPHYLHYEMITAALNAGKTVIAEKPVTITREDFDKLQRNEHIDKLALVFQNRLNPCVQVLKSIIRENKLGKIQCARAILTWKRTREYYQADAWRGKWATEGGGVLINQAVHTLDLMSYLVGDIQSVKANMATYALNDTIEVDDTFSAYFKYTSGATGIFFATNAYGANNSPEIEIRFENGIARYMDNKLYINGELVDQNAIATGEKAYWGTTHAALIMNFYDHDTAFSLADAQNTMYTMFAMYESAKNSGCETLINL